MTHRSLRIVHLLSSLNVGGLEQFVVRIAHSQRERGHDVRLLYRESGPLLAQAQTLGLPLIQLTGSHKLVRSLQALKQHAVTRADVLHCHNSHLLPYAALGKTIGSPVVVMTRHSQREQASPGAFEIARTEAVVAVSHAAAAALETAWPGFRGKVTVIHNGIEPRPSQRTRAEARAELGLGEEPAALIVARLDDLKGHVDLLQAMADPAVRATPLTLLIAGDGNQRSTFEAQAQQLDITKNVRFLGFRNDIRELQEAADFFVLPSLLEGLPLSVLEAMAAGLPVIVTPVGGVPEVVPDERFGLTVPVRDPQTLAAALARLATDSGLRRRLGDAGSQRVREEFSWPTMLERYEALYRRLLAPKGVS